MAVELCWARRCAYSWCVRLGLDCKRLAWQSRPVDLATQEQQSPQLRRPTPRGRVPVLTDGGYVACELVAILYHLGRNNPAPPLFGASAEEGGVIVRVIEEFQSYSEPRLTAVVGALCAARLRRPRAAVLEELLTAAAEARTIEGRLAKSDWVVGPAPSAADLVICPWIELLRHSLLRPAGDELRARFLPVEVQ
jgi:glutathione S-transferase